MIKIQNLEVRFKEKIIFEKLNINFDLGKIHGIFGLNGEGKTTFFNTLYGFCSHSGDILYFENKIKKSDISYLESENYFYRYLTGQEYLDIHESNSNPVLFNIEKLVSILKLPLKDLVENYSSGMKKKIALLGILKLGRKVYLLDEPFNGVDIESVYFIKEIIKQLKENGNTVFISSHIIESLLGVCDDYYVLADKEFRKYNDETEFKEYCNFIYNRVSLKVKDSIL